MSGLKQLRSRVKSIKSTQKITKAMQVVSAAKLRKVKDLAEDLNDYSNVLASIVHDVTLNLNQMELSSDELKFFRNDYAHMPHLLLIMTSERGLCGSFNSAIIKAAKRDIASFKEQGVKVRLIIVGKKGYDAFKNEYSDLIEEHYHVVKEKSLRVALQIKEKIISLIQQEKIGSCFIYYNEFKNALTQVMTRKRVLPVEAELRSDTSVYEYEGSGFVDILINLYITGVMKYGFLQNKASEEAARMTAMDNATRNAGDLIDSLTLKLNRSRQAMITTELTEIISGAEAL
jgi:F-type H+-transporting ATPase subunit gamma